MVFESRVRPQSQQDEAGAGPSRRKPTKSTKTTTKFKEKPTKLKPHSTKLTKFNKISCRWGRSQSQQHPQPLWLNFVDFVTCGSNFVSFSLNFVVLVDFVGFREQGPSPVSAGPDPSPA